jgi:signal transduction histidine kinase
LRNEAAAVSDRGVIDVDVEGLPDHAEVVGDPDQLARLFRNVLDNGERYATSAIAVGVAIDAQWIEATVADDGPGIPAADRGRVFERFTRLDDARDRDTGGTGLGLAIAREIVAAHGGSIAVVDAERGARIAVRLPKAPGQHRPERRYPGGSGRELGY